MRQPIRGRLYIPVTSNQLRQTSTLPDGRQNILVKSTSTERVRLVVLRSFRIYTYVTMTTRFTSIPRVLKSGKGNEKKNRSLLISIIR